MTTAHSATFCFPGSAQRRRRSSLEASTMESSENRPPEELPRSVENPFLQNVRTPLASTQNNGLASPPLLPFSPFSPPLSLRPPPSKENSTKFISDDAEHWVLPVDVAGLGLRQRKKSESGTVAPKERTPNWHTTSSYSLGTNYCVPSFQGDSKVLSTTGFAATEELVSPNAIPPLQWLSESSLHHSRKDRSLIEPASTNLFFLPSAVPGISEPAPALLTEDDILNYQDAPAQLAPRSNHSCWEQALRILFGMEEDDAASATSPRIFVESAMIHRENGEGLYRHNNFR